MRSENYNALEETAYLLSTPANAEHLRASIKQAEQGQYKENQLIEIEDEDKRDE